MGKVYTGYDGTSEREHGLCACTVGDYLSVQAHKSHLKSNQGVKLHTLHIHKIKIHEAILYRIIRDCHGQITLKPINEFDKIICKL